MIIEEKAFGLLTDEQQEYLSKYELEVYVHGHWVHENGLVNPNFTYRVKRIRVNTLAELDDCLSPFLTEEFPFIAMDEDLSVFLFNEKPKIEGKIFNAWRAKELDIDYINLGSVDWKESLVSLHPMEEL